MLLSVFEQEQPNGLTPTLTLTLTPTVRWRWNETQRLILSFELWASQTKSGAASFSNSTSSK